MGKKVNIGRLKNIIHEFNNLFQGRIFEMDGSFTNSFLNIARIIDVVECDKNKKEHVTDLDIIEIIALVINNVNKPIFNKLVRYINIKEVYNAINKMVERLKNGDRIYAIYIPKDNPNIDDIITFCRRISLTEFHLPLTFIKKDNKDDNIMEIMIATKYTIEDIAEGLSILTSDDLVVIDDVTDKMAFIENDKKGDNNEK